MAAGKVTVFSTSGRAERFVARMAPLVHQHGAPTVAATVIAAEMTQLEDLPGLVAQADVVVCVRGKGPSSRRSLWTNCSARR
ncbi:MAG: hypothetical protein U1U88_001300 [Lawsonella clevelandensis]